MFGISGWEFLLIAVVMLIFVKTEDIPEIAKQIGLFFRKMRVLFFDVKSSISRELDLDGVKKHTVIDINGEPRKAYDVMEVFDELEGSNKKTPSAKVAKKKTSGKKKG
jgi:Sec-independent protein translocase protein TatA